MQLTSSACFEHRVHFREYDPAVAHPQSPASARECSASISYSVGVNTVARVVLLRVLVLHGRWLYVLCVADVPAGSQRKSFERRFGMRAFRF